MVLKRLRAFLPGGLLDGVNFQFTPKLGRDVFPGNHWKVQGSAETLNLCRVSTVRVRSWTRRLTQVKGTVESYAKAHLPWQVGYDPKARSCFVFPKYWKFNASQHGAYVEATTYLQKESA